MTGREELEPDVPREAGAHAAVVTAPDQHGHPWWRTAVLYQIYPRSFADGDGDGVGDLHGLLERLDHLRWLGVDGLWLSPIYRSPMADFGYDVSDHTAIDPVFGDLDTFDRLVAEAHARDLRVILDWVPNHTSDRHPWFLESRSSRTSPKRDWYVWRDGSPDRPPNNWRAAFGGDAWTWDEATGQWYLHLFLPEQPDLNWANPEVEAAMHDVLRFWLDRGVDGFRADVVHLIGKDPALPDQPPELADVDLVGVHDHPSTHDLLKRIRGVLDGYDGDRMMVGEVNLGLEHLRPYYGERDQLHLVFNFAPMMGPWTAASWERALRTILAEFGPADAWPTWVLSNHDNPRHRTRYGGSLARARAAAVLLLTLPGTPFLYAGEELGLEDADIPPERVVDPGGRDGCRAPIPWTAAPPHGWPSEPWLPFPPEAEARNVEALRGDPDSILALYRRLLALRRATPALHAGAGRVLDDTPETVLAFERVAGTERRVVAIGFAREGARLDAFAGWTVELSSAGPSREGRTFDGRLAGDEAVVLAPAG